MPPSMIWAGAGAWITPSSFLNAYLGRRVTITLNFTGTTYRRSDTSSPISTFCLPACSASSSGSMTVSIRSRWGAKPLRRRGARFPSACSRALLTWALIAAMPVSISSKTKGLLFIVTVRRAELFRSAAEPDAVEGLQDLHQPLDTRIGIGVARPEIGDFALQSIGASRPLGHGKHHGAQRLYVFREVEIGRRHWPTGAHFARFSRLFSSLIHFAAAFLPNNLRRLDRHGPDPLPVRSAQDSSAPDDARYAASRTSPFQDVLNRGTRRSHPTCAFQGW